MHDKENRFLYDPVGNALAVCAEIIEGFVIARALPQQSGVQCYFCNMQEPTRPNGLTQ